MSAEPPQESSTVPPHPEQADAPAIKPATAAAHGQVVTPWDVQGQVSEDGKQLAIDYDKLIADMDDVVYSSVSEEEASDPDEAGPSSSRRAEEKSISRRLRRLERMMTAVGLAVVNDRRKKGSKKK